MASEIVLRSPSSHTYSAKIAPSSVSSTMKPPAYDWLSGTWNVCYSSLPLWKGKQNVRISYSACTTMPQDSSRMPDLDDHVESQKIGKEKFSSIHGISRPVEVNGIEHGLAYRWRGKGLLKLITSDWEILGYGTDKEAQESNEWVVTFFSKTAFTPAGIDIYTRAKAKLSETTLNSIKSALAELCDDEFKSLVNTMFEIPQTD